MSELSLLNVENLSVGFVSDGQSSSAVNGVSFHIKTWRNSRFGRRKRTGQIGQRAVHFETAAIRRLFMKAAKFILTMSI